MERKSIGAFMSSLRKAKGLTQKQLAQLLNVSDKAISRWERDEAQPDLSQIPVMAEIFGVTSDELLRGCRMDRPISQNHGPKTIQCSYNTKSLISVFGAGAGIISALVFAYGLERENRMLGYIFCGFFCLAAGTFQTVSAIHVLQTTEQIETRDKAISTTINIYIMLVSVIAGMTAVMNRHVGLTEIIYWAPGIAMPLSCILIRVKWFVIEPLMASIGKCFQTYQRNSALAELRKETLSWELFFFGILLYFTLASAYSSPDLGTFIGIILLIIELPVSSLIYHLRKSKLK